MPIASITNQSGKSCITLFLQTEFKQLLRTIILQSFRTHDVPAWVHQSMRSVEDWARAEQWEYACTGDEFLALAPPDIQQCCAGHIYALTDVCRLVWLSQMLKSGYQRVIWADADLLVFDRARLHMPAPGSAAFAHELFLRVESDGRIRAVHSMNNALMVFEQGGMVLPRYLAVSLAKLRSAPPGPLPRTVIGPALLKAMNKRAPLNLIHGVGLFTFALMQQIAEGGGPLTEKYLQHAPAPLGAANLCHFMRNTVVPENRPQFDAVYDRAVEKLLENPSGLFSLR